MNNYEAFKPLSTMDISHCEETPYIDKEGGKNAINYLSDESLELLDIDRTFENMINPSLEENENSNEGGEQ